MIQSNTTRTYLSQLTAFSASGESVVLILLGLICAGILPGCDVLVPDSDRASSPEYVVESYQVAGELLKPVRLSRTVDLMAGGSFSDRAVEGARVRVERLDENGETFASYPYQPHEDSAGVYIPEAAAIVQPLTSYRLEIDIPSEEHTITATTVVPDTFSVVGLNADSLQYQGASQFRINITPSRYEGRQGGFIVSVRALTPGPKSLVPFRRTTTDSDSSAVRSLRVVSSPLLNASSYDENADGTLGIDLPWLSIAFFGPNRVVTQAVDDNLYDFIRSQAAQGQNMSLSPGEILSVIEHVEGGTGVFGSYSKASTQVFVAPPTE